LIAKGPIQTTFNFESSETPSEAEGSSLASQSDITDNHYYEHIEDREAFPGLSDTPAHKTTHLSMVSCKTLGWMVNTPHLFVYSEAFEYTGAATG